MPVIPTVQVSPPTLTELPFGLKSVVTEQLRTDKHTQAGVEYEPKSGNTTATQGINCATVQPPLAPETFPDGADTIPTVVTKPFLIYAGVKAKTVGRPLEDLQARAKEKLQLGAYYAIERTLWRGDAEVKPLMGPQTAVLSANPVDPDLALGLLEQWIADHVGAVGAIHTCRAGIAVLGKNVSEKGSKLQTKLQTPVAFGPGYLNTGPDGTAPAANVVWVVATGPVLVNRSAPKDVPENLDQALNLTTNNATVFSMEVVSVGYEGGAAAVPVVVELD